MFRKIIIYWPNFFLYSGNINTAISVRPYVKYWLCNGEKKKDSFLIFTRVTVNERLILKKDLQVLSTKKKRSESIEIITRGNTF